MSSQQMQPMVPCVHCGKPIPEKSQFCMHCGKPQQRGSSLGPVWAFMRKHGHWIALAALFYILSPLDVVPDFIPCLGWGDDAVAGVSGIGALALRIAGAGGMSSWELAETIQFVVLIVVLGLIMLAAILVGDSVW